MPPSINKIGAGPWVRMMVHSWPGWGKTVLAATCAEAGWKTLIIRSPLDQVPARALHSGAEECVVSTWEDMMGGDGILDYLRMADHGYEWVWMDNWSVLQDVLLDDVWEGTIAAKPGRALILEGPNKGKPNLSPTSGLDKGEYGRNMERIQQFVRHTVGINNFHIGMTAHPIEAHHVANDEGGDLLIPYIQGKNMSEKICGYCNMIGFLEVIEEDDEILRRLHFRESTRWYAKDLYDAFPKGYIDNPSMAQIMEAVTVARKKKQATNTTTPARRGGRRGKAAAAVSSPRPGPRRRRTRREQ